MSLLIRSLLLVVVSCSPFSYRVMLRSVRRLVDFESWFS